MVKKPTIFQVPHSALNPNIYRRIKNVGSLDDLARILHTQSNWEEQFTKDVRHNRAVVNRFKEFQDCPDNIPEVDVQSRFSRVVIAIADALDVHIYDIRKRKVIIGGVLSHYDLDIRGVMDPFFVDEAGYNLLSSEVTTTHAFTFGEMWYRKSRGAQVLSTLYSTASPTFLVTPHCWKLFVENGERNKILTFPYGTKETETPHVRSSKLGTMETHVESSLLLKTGLDFIKAITICLLSERKRPLSEIRSLFQSRFSPPTRSSQVSDSGVDSPGFTQEPKTKKQRTTRSTQIQGQGVEPRFLSGCHAEGEPIYSCIRILPEETVAAIEEEIRQEEVEVQRRLDRQAQFQDK
jgi:hypothetical protein